jgi:hypothetical protein
MADTMAYVKNPQVRSMEWDEPRCGECRGMGTIAYPVCNGGSDHMGHDCGGTVCGSVEAECADCKGTGWLSCELCDSDPGERALTYAITFMVRGRVMVDRVCTHCKDEWIRDWHRRERKRAADRRHRRLSGRDEVPHA